MTIFRVCQYGEASEFCLRGGASYARAHCANWVIRPCSVCSY